MADYVYVTNSGTIVPDTATVLGEVQAEYQTAFGADINPDPSTPQGLLIAAETSARTGVIRNNAQVANQINPNLAGGIFLDAICALTGLQRRVASSSVVPGVQLNGVPGTVIPAGVIAKTTAGDEFASASAVTVNGVGMAEVEFVAVVPGAVPCPIGALTQIVTGVLGWDAVTNPQAAVLGQPEETDAALRARRRVTLALQGTALPTSIMSAIYDVTGVRSMSFRENTFATVRNIDGVSMAPHSIYACVEGGTDADVANALFVNKSLGAGYNPGPGPSVVVPVTEPLSGQVYDVTFARPELVPIKARVAVRAGSSLLDPQTVVREAILGLFAGLVSGEDRIGVGSDVSPFEMSGAITAYAPGLYVSSVEVALVSSLTYTTNPININIWQLATITASSIQVIVA